MGKRVRYARSGDVNIAYVELPGGPADVVMVSGFVTNVSKVDALDTCVPHASGFARIVALDKRGWAALRGHQLTTTS